MSAIEILEKLAAEPNFSPASDKLKVAHDLLNESSEVNFIGVVIAEEKH